MIDWTSENDALLLKLKGEGKTQKEIALLFNTSVGSIAGRLMRLRNPDYKPKPSRKKEVPVLVTSEGLALRELEPRHCRWPLDNGNFCAQDQQEGSSYCPFHKHKSLRHY